VLDKFIQIIEENDIAPEDIERIKAQPHPVAKFRFGRENKLLTPDDYSFNTRYLLACAAYRISPAHWQDAEIRQDSRIQEFMQHPGISVAFDEEDYAQAKREEPKAYLQRIEVVAKGKTFKAKSIHPKGGWWSKEFRNTDEELISKFTDNTSRTLPMDKVKKATQDIMNLEKLSNVGVLMEVTIP